MLVPFHYFGISDIEVNGQLVDENTTIQDLNRSERVNHILENLAKFGTDDGIIRGLVFCSKNEESTFLSNELNQHGYKTIALSGNSSDDERSRAIDLLETTLIRPVIILEYIHIKNDTLIRLLNILEKEKYNIFTINENLICYPEADKQFIKFI